MKTIMFAIAILLVSVWAMRFGPGSQPRPDPAAEQTAMIEHGKNLVTKMDCNGCHTPFVNGKPDMTRMLSGHPEAIKITEIPKPISERWPVSVSDTNTAWAGPWGVSFTANLTPDEHSGIGSWSEQQFVDAIKKGKHMGANARNLLPPMPWEAYAAGSSDYDLKSMYAYLRSIPPIVNLVPQHPLEP